MNYAVESALAEYSENELIFASELYRKQLTDKVSEVAFYKTLERLCDSGRLEKISKGVYHLPKKGRFGTVPPSEKDIVNVFVEEEKGVVVGYSLYNALNLTTQISKSTVVLSSRIDGNVKNIKNVNIQKVNLRFTDEVNSVICALEVLQNLKFIEDLNLVSYKAYTEKIAQSFSQDAFDKIIGERKYKKSTIASMRDVLDYYKVENNLSDELSDISEYKYLSMRELNEITPV